MSVKPSRAFIAGGTPFLCFAFFAPVVVGTAGCGGSSGSITQPGNGGAIDLGRAAPLVGTFTGVQTLANGKREETTIELIPGTATETLSGSYTSRVLSPRTGGGSDYVSVSTGTIAANVLPGGNVRIVFTSDEETRANSSAGSEYAIGGSGKTLTEVISGLSYTRVQDVVQTYRANSVAGNWSGVPDATGGFQLRDPLSGMPVGPFTSIRIRYDLASGSFGSTYTAAVTLTDPTTGVPYTANAVQARLFSEYDGQLPENFLGKTKLDAGDFFVFGKGNLPSSAGTITIPNVPVLGSVSVPLANRAFLFEAGVGGFESDRIQIGTLYIKFEKSDPLYSLLPFAGINPDATSGYVPIGNFLLSNKAPVATPTPSPSPTPAAPTLPIGTVEFSNASGTNANTATITNAESNASFQGKILTASLFKAGSSDSYRVLSLQLGTTDDSSLAVGKTFAIAPTTTVATGKASVSYLDQGVGGSVRKFWLAQGGSVVVVAHDSQTTTLRVVNAAMKGSNTGSTETPTGTFTINATGKF